MRIWTIPSVSFWFIAYSDMYIVLISHIATYVLKYFQHTFCSAHFFSIIILCIRFITIHDPCYEAYMCVSENKWNHFRLQYLFDEAFQICCYPSVCSKQIIALQLYLKIVSSYLIEFCIPYLFFISITISININVIQLCISLQLYSYSITVRINCLIHPFTLP